MKTLPYILIFSLILYGCEKKEFVGRDRPDFQQFYKEAELFENNFSEKPQELPAVTISAKDMPLRAFLKLVAEQSGISIITDEGLEDRPVTFEVTGISADKVLAALARRLNVAISRSGKLYHVGQIRPEDRAIFITKCARLTAANAKNAIEVMMSKDGKCVTFDDGMMIIADKAELINKISDLLDDISNAPTDTWVLQFQIISFRKDDMKDLGIDANVNYALASTAAKNASIMENVNASMSLAMETGKERLVAQPLMLVEDGTTAKLTDGESIPIPTKTVSAEGTVTTTGVTYQKSGTEISVYIRDMGNKYARLEIDMAVNSTTGYIDSYPVTKGQEAKFTATIQSNQQYLLCNLSQNYKSENNSKAFAPSIADGIGNFSFSLGKNKQENDSLMQVWVRAYKIGGML